MCVTFACEGEGEQLLALSCGIVVMAIIEEVKIDDEDVVNYYKEKKWGKTEDGEYLVDGYTFKGKRTLNKVLVEMKNTLKKGVENQIGNIKFKAQDVRKSGTA